MFHASLIRVRKGVIAPPTRDFYAKSPDHAVGPSSEMAWKFVRGHSLVTNKSGTRQEGAIRRGKGRHRATSDLSAARSVGEIVEFAANQ